MSMYAVIMAGGRGTRFWPRSRESKPKQLLNLTGEKTLIQETVDRISPLVPLKNVIIVTGAAHAEEIIAQFPSLPRENVIIEPRGRNTAPCIGLAALYLRKKDPDAIMVVLPADHMISNTAAFVDALSTAIFTARQGDYLITVGIKPEAPETGYGYIEGGGPFSSNANSSVLNVVSFREKPDLPTACSFLEKGTFYWNSGMFVWKVSSIMKALQRTLPGLYRELSTLEGTLGTHDENEALTHVYNRIDAISIDYGVMEKASNVLLVPGDFGWNDLGSWDALWNISEKDVKNNVVRGPVIAVDSCDSLVFAKDKLVTLVGVDNLIVVETDDAILILKRGRSQDVKHVVEILEKQNQRGYL